MFSRVENTPAAEIERLYALQQQNRERVGSEDAAKRITRLRRLHDALLQHREAIRVALREDFAKPDAETDLSEIYPVLEEARHAIRHLRGWMKPKRVSAPIALLGSRSRIQYEPKGVVLIISPWNFPFNLSLGPLVSAIAAGNCAMLKPSEMTPAASRCMEKILRDCFDESEVCVVQGDSSVATALLAKKFDHIFFTGSPAVGKVVMHAAAEHLTSVTLELGGKSPVVVGREADLHEAAKKIAWGKFFNSGQICIAPDYVLVDEAVHAPFLAFLRSSIEALGGATSRGLIVNDGHARRLERLLDDAVARGARLIVGGVTRGRALEPTVVGDVPAGASILEEEIFGPLLPVVPYATVEEALTMIGERERPLVLYVFSRNRRFVRDVIARTRAGGTVVNDTLLHFYQLNLPFGGTGQSGMGKGHGFFGFEAFSNARGIFEQPTRMSTMQLLYPPYSRIRQRLIDLTLRFF